MKKVIFALVLVIAMLAGCSSGPDYKITMSKPLYFVKDKDTPFEIKVTESNKAVTGLKISVELSMANMDHGTYKANLVEIGNGRYAGKVQLPMDGKYEMDYTLKKGDNKSEKVIDYVVKKPAGVATINGKWIKKEDLDFYQFTNKLDLAMKRDQAKKRYSGKQLDEELSFLDSQEKTTGDKNQLLTQIIRLKAVALLAVEKGHTATTEEITQAIEKMKEQYNQSESAKALIQQYGEEKFWNLEKEQSKDMVLATMVQQDVIAQVKKDNPKASNQEIQYDADQNFDDLLVSQMNSLNIQIL
ncbi:MAG: FixH family protein [Bacillota bacterium]|nr:FixH family protein [Bacillota bacterium]